MSALALACFLFAAHAAALAEPLPCKIAISRPELTARPRDPSEFADLPGPCPVLPASAPISPRELGAVSRVEALADLDTYFRLLRWCYSGYFYFGGDSAFLPAQGRAKAAIEGIEGNFVSAAAVEDAVAASLTFVTDLHFAFGSKVFRANRVLCMDQSDVFEKEGGEYYLREAASSFHVLSVDGAKPKKRIKLSLDASGRLVYRLVLYLPSSSPDFSSSRGQAIVRLELRDGAERRTERTVFVPQVGAASDGGDSRLFALDDCGDYRRLALHRLYPATQSDLPGLKAFSASGAKLRGKEPIIMDIRGNPGGSDQGSVDFLLGFAGAYPNPYAGCLDRRSAAAEALVRSTADSLRRGDPGGYDSYLKYGLKRFVIPSAQGGRWGSGMESEARGARRTGLVMAISDRGVASSGESLLGALRLLPTTLQIGAPSAGCVNFGNVMTYALPKSGIVVRVPMSRMLMRARIGETVGYEPDIWAPADAALDRAEAFLARYGADAIANAIEVEAEAADPRETKMR
jgi:hypothetical protein